MATNKDFVVKNGLQVGANASIEGAITTVDSIQFDLTANTTVGEGQLAWNAEEGTLDLGLINGNVTLQVGQEQHVYARNVGTVDIANGTVVRVTGASGNKITVEAASYDQEGISSTTIGVATEAINQNSSGYVTLQGTVRDIDTSSISEGATIYLGANGAFTATKPDTPNHLVVVGYVIRSHATEGSILLHVQNGWEIEELHNVLVTNIANNQILTYDAVNSYWKNSDDLNLPGDLTVAGNFTVSGNTTLVNSNNLAIEDLNIVLANGAADAAAADGAGITIDGANATLTYDSGSDGFNFNKSIGIGVNPSRDIHIEASAPAIRMQDLDTGDFADVVYNAGTYAIDIDPTSVDANPRFRVDINNAEVFRVDQNSLATLTSINTTTANTTTLNATTVNATTLNGAFGNTAVTIASNYPVTPSTGNMWFDNLNLTLKIYDGNNWQDAVPSGAGSSGNTASTDANATFAKYTYVLSSAGSTVSGPDIANNTLTYDTSGIENVEVFVNGVKQVEGASYDYTATTGSSVGFTSALSAGDVVDIQVYELLTNDAFYLKTETYTQTEVNSQISTALGSYVPAAGGTFTGSVTFNNTVNMGDTSGDHVLMGVSASTSMMGYDSTGIRKEGGMSYRADRGSLQILTANTWNGSAIGINHIRDDYQLGTTIDEPETISMRVDSYTFGTIGGYANTSVRSMQLNAGTNGSILLSPGGTANVGIGGTLPQQDLAVITNTNYNPPTLGAHSGNFSILKSDSSASGVYGLLMGVAGSGNAWLQAQRTAGAADAYDLLLQPSGGKVGIGISSPLSPLQVQVANQGGFSLGNDNYVVGGFSDTGYRGVYVGYVSTGQIGTLTAGGYSSKLRLQTFDTQVSGVINTIEMSDKGHIYPTTSTQDLGTSADPWRNIYTQDLVLSNEARATGNDIDGTKGNWTVQEGEDHLYLINNKNGKKYRFALEEIE